MLKLTGGPFELLLAPALGGSVARFDYVCGKDRHMILRGAESTPISVLDTACFPLVPFCNRIRNGRFDFRGREIVLAPNMAGDPSPLHGQGWLAAWEVERSSPSTADLLFRHPAGEWPWAYEARLSYRLDGAGLGLRLSCRNLSPEPMPCGLGQHPYFPCDEKTRLDTDVARALTVDDKVLPVDDVAAVGRYDLRDRLICGQGLDNGFSQWGGSAVLRSPSLPFAISLSSRDAGYFQVFSPVGGALFVAEPVTHANAALNRPEEDWPGLGMRILDPGEEMSLEMRLSVEPVARSGR